MEDRHCDSSDLEQQNVTFPVLGIVLSVLKLPLSCRETQHLSFRLYVVRSSQAQSRALAVRLIISFSRPGLGIPKAVWL